MNLLKYILIFIFFTLIETSYAQYNFNGEWVYATSKENEMRVYVLDHPLKENIRDRNDWFSKYYPNSSNTTIKIWVRFEFDKKKKKEKIKNQDIESMIYLYEFNLTSIKSRTIQTIYYNKNGEVLYSDDDEYAYWENIIPNTLGHIIYQTTLEIIEEIQEQEQFQQNLQAVIDAFASKNRNKIVEMINYPYDMGVLPAIKNKAEMTQRFDEVFDDYLIKLIGNSTVSDWGIIGNYLDAIDQGFHNGESDGWHYKEHILLNVECTKITTINDETNLFSKLTNEMIERERNSLHESIRNFESIDHTGITSTTRFRIDYVKNEDSSFYRLCLWEKSKSWDSEPDIIVGGGEWLDGRDQSGQGYDHVFDPSGVYIFKTNEFAYLIETIHDYWLTVKDINKLTDIIKANDNGYYDIFDIEYSKYVLSNEHATIKSEEVKKILSREEVIAEITKVEQLKKQQEYIQIASQKFQEGELSQAKSWYEKALNIKHSDTIAKSLRLVKEEIKRVNELKELLKQRYTDVSNNHSLLENPQIINQLPTIKKGYDVTYRTCLENINQGLKGSWVQVASTYNENLPNFEKRETWANEDQNILDKINEFSQKVVSYNKFNDKILEFLANNDKKSLKIFKEKDPSVIISFLMNYVQTP